MKIEIICLKEYAFAYGYIHQHHYDCQWVCFLHKWVAEPIKMEHKLFMETRKFRMFAYVSVYEPYLGFQRWI